MDLRSAGGVPPWNLSSHPGCHRYTPAEVPRWHPLPYIKESIKESDSPVASPEKAEQQKAVYKAGAANFRAEYEKVARHSKRRTDAPE